MIQSLSSNELLDLLRTARAGTERDWLILLVSFWHALRVSEVLKITPLMLSDGFLTIQRLKGSKKTVQELVAHENPLLDEKNALFDFTRNMDRNQRLFTIGRRRADQLIKLYGEQAGIPKMKCHMHVLKHTRLTLSHRGGADLRDLQLTAGHANLNSTAVYVERDPQEAAAATQRVIRF